MALLKTVFNVATLRLSAVGKPMIAGLALGLVFAGGGFSPSLRAAGSIQVQAVDLTDTTPGQDLWQYRYAVSGFDFQIGQGLSVFFDWQLYTALQNPQPNPSAAWDSIVIQPDVILHQPGYFDSLALINSPLLPANFQVDFVWLGLGTPESQVQSFTIYDVNFSSLVDGATAITAVPEPQATLLLSLGLFGWWTVNRASRKFQTSKHESNP